MPDAFEAELLAIMPRLRAIALRLTRDRTHAEDLLQDSLVLALVGRHSFELGTNLAGWMYRLMRNRLISQSRRVRVRTVSLDEPGAMAVGVAGNQEDHMICRQLERELAQLPAVQQVALLLVGAAGYSYGEAARAVGCRVGTAKSRVARARETLKARMDAGVAPSVGRARSANPAFAAPGERLRAA